MLAPLVSLLLIGYAFSMERAKFQKNYFSTNRRTEQNLTIYGHRIGQGVQNQIFNGGPKWNKKIIGFSKISSQVQPHRHSLKYPASALASFIKETTTTLTNVIKSDNKWISQTLVRFVFCISAVRYYYVIIRLKYWIGSYRSKNV